MSRPSQVTVIGPGRVGTTLARALPTARYRVTAVAGRGDAALLRFRDALPGARVLPAAEAVAGADLVLLCVPDDELAAQVAALAEAGTVRPGSRWVHCAGGHGLELLRPAARAGAGIAACHPAQTFPDPDTGLAVLPGTAWAVTAADEDLPWVRRLVTDLGGTPVEVDEGSRILYHAALVVGANGTAAVVAEARALLVRAGVADPAPFLAPLTVSAARNVAERGPAALTGPVRRGDAGTVAAHLTELAALPDTRDAYVALARLALAQATALGLSATRAEAVRAALEGR